jgi:hypothetical protein
MPVEPISSELSDMIIRHATALHSEKISVQGNNLEKLRHLVIVGLMDWESKNAS